MNQVEFLEKGFDESSVSKFFSSPEQEFFWEFLGLFYRKGVATLDELKNIRKKINCGSHLNDIIFQLTEMGIIFKSGEQIKSSSPGAPFGIMPVYSLTSSGKNFIENSFK